jgi:hypothetical protein
LDGLPVSSARDGQPGLGDLLFLVIGQELGAHPGTLQVATEIIGILPPDDGRLGGLQIPGGVVLSL